VPPVDRDNGDLQRELEELDGPDAALLFGEGRADLDAPPGALDAAAVERRTLLAATLLPSMFPTSTGDVLTAVAGADLPEDLVMALEGLPARTYETLQEIWVAIGGPAEEREGSPALAEARHEEPAPIEDPAKRAADRRPSPEVAPSSPAAPVADTGSPRPVKKVVVMTRGFASLPLAIGGAACTLGAGVLQRVAEDLTDAAVRVSGVRH
jgi:hypothetical protein